MEKGLKLQTHSARRVRYTPPQILARVAFAGTVVAVSVVVARFAGPYWTGLFSTFPAVMLSTLVILHVTQGRAFASATAKILTISAPNILVFAAVASAVFPGAGLVAGILAGYTAARALHRGAAALGFPGFVTRTGTFDTPARRPRNVLTCGGAYDKLQKLRNRNLSGATQPSCRWFSAQKELS